MSRSARLRYWLPTALFAVHVAEEWLGGFPDWATRHFGTTSPRWFVVSHVPLVLAMIAISARASARGARSRWVWLAAALMVGLFGNAVFHVVTSALFDEYSPGLVTAALLFAPATPIVIKHAAADGALTTAGIAAACVVGALGSGLVVLSLMVDVPM